MRVSFTLPEEGNPRLHMHDVAGRTVVTLALGRWPAGRHDLVWNADALPAGVYFARARLQGLGDRVRRFVWIR